MKTYTLTEEELKEVIQAAFYKGEDWGVTYQSWFTPSEDEHRDKLNAAKREILNRVKATVK